MDEIINLNQSGELAPVNSEWALIEVTEGLLMDARSALDSKSTFSVPIAQLSTLGAGVSSLIPALNTVTQTASVTSDSLYMLANAGVGDVLKVAKNGNFWGAFKTADGASKFAQLRAAGPISVTTQIAAAFNPATIMMAVALFSIENELGKIEDMQKQIISFLEIEKESEIEADVESLMGIIKKYKGNWDNERFLSGNHNQVLTYQNRARKNMIAYQKKVAKMLDKKQLIFTQANIKQAYSELEKLFKYYRLSLYAFSLSSLIEIMLSGNFKESYIADIKDEIREMTQAYRSLFDRSSHYLEELSASALDGKVLKTVGYAEKAVGKLIGNIPLINGGSVDEFFRDCGAQLSENAIGREKKTVHLFSSLSNPGTNVFMDKMEDMIRIYNHTEQIYFDAKKIYLVSG